MEKEIKEEIETYLKQPSDFQEGLRLLQKISKKYGLLARMNKVGRLNPGTYRYQSIHEKIIHELRQSLKPPRVYAPVSGSERYHH